MSGIPSRQMRFIPVLVGAGLFAGSLLQGQCPNGSPPPCRTPARVDTNAFLVLPFVVRGPANVSYLGESMVDLFEMALNGVAGVRIETAPRAMRQLLDPTPLVDPASASGTAVEYGTGRIVSGTVVAVGADVRIRVQVYDAIRRRAQFTVEGRARPDSVASLVDSLTAALLARRLVPPSQRRLLSIGDYATKSPTALQAYLVARRHVLRHERRLAIDSVRSATRQDSTFGLAYYLLLRLEGASVGSTGVSLSAILAAARPHYARYSERLRTMFEIAETGNR